MINGDIHSKAGCYHSCIKLASEIKQSSNNIASMIALALGHILLRLSLTTSQLKTLL